MSYDIAEAKLQHITIVNKRLSVPSQHGKPLQVMPIQQPHNMRYKMDSVQASDRCNRGDSGLVAVQDDDYGDKTAILDNMSRPPFIIVWTTCAYNIPWCELVSCSHADLERYRKTQHTWSWLPGTGWAINFDDPSSSSSMTMTIRLGGKTHDELICGRIRIRAEIKEANILDRHIWKLCIKIDSLAE